MITEDTTKKIIETLGLIAEALPHIEDDFFVKKLQLKMEGYLSGYIKYKSGDEDSGVAQYYLIENLLNSINSLIDLFETINHLGISRKTTPLLSATRSLLSLKLGLLNLRSSLETSLNKKSSIVPNINLKLDNSNQTVVRATEDNQKNLSQKIEPNSSKEKILNFIKKSPRSRTKDIIHEFNALSDRTVKRNLGELLRIGLINKKIENKAVYYSAEK